MTDYSKKYFEQLEKQNIKIALNMNKLKPKTQKLCYRIVLGGSTISGKTTYINTFIQKSFYDMTISTIGSDKYDFRYPKYEDKKCKDGILLVGMEDFMVQ